MSAAPVARYLAEFGEPSARLLPFPFAAKGGPSHAPLRNPADELADRLAEATARGHEEGRIAAFAESEAAVAAERARSAADIAAERARWIAEQGDALADGVASGLAAIETAIADSVARILAPFLASERRERSIAELVAILATLLARNDTPVMRLEGPEDLITALRHRLGPDAGAIEYRARDGADVTVLVGETMIETCLGAWAAGLAEARHG